MYNKHQLRDVILSVYNYLLNSGFAAVDTFTNSKLTDTFLAVTALADVNALMLLVGQQEEHPALKTSAMRCWRGYLSKCK